MKTTIKFYGSELSVSGLKRECETIAEVFSKLSGIKSYQRSLSGIKKEGEEPEGTTYWVMCGSYPLRNEEEFKASIEKFKQSLPEVITLDVIRAIKPEMDKIFDAHVYIEDSRITEEEAAKQEIEREQDDKKRQEDANALITLIGLGGEGEAVIKENEMFLTIQAYFNDSHSMSDYYHPHHSLGREYALAIVNKGARKEAIVRDQLRWIPELSKLEWTWNIQGYTGGHGTFMESSVVGIAPYEAYDGRTEVNYWYEIQFSNSPKLPKSRLFSSVVDTPAKIEGSAPTGDKIATCKINKAKGGIELYFPGKPAASVLDDLKANGFRWSRFGKCWYKLDNAIARKVAAKYADIPQSLNATERLKDAAFVDAQEQAAIAHGNY